MAIPRVVKSNLWDFYFAFNSYIQYLLQIISMCAITFFSCGFFFYSLRICLIFLLSITLGPVSFLFRFELMRLWTYRFILLRVQFYVICFTLSLCDDLISFLNEEWLLFLQGLLIRVHCWPLLILFYYYQEPLKMNSKQPPTDYEITPYTEFFAWGSDAYGQLALANTDNSLISEEDLAKR